jgi:UDP-2,3-diacylglucosamine pyrophosphatase LpxH
VERRFDYLVVSDLHLRGGYRNPTEGLYHFDEEFADFLRHYRLNRASPRPWQLIIAGDFVEFLYVTELPDRDSPLLRHATFSEDERRYGLSTEAHKARWKLDTILRNSHPQLLLALARFVAEGNHVVILHGNHDAEMFWPEVQEHFFRLIAEHHPEDVSYLEMKATVAERVQFAPWYWYVPEVLYVEHGCQYDAFCSFEYFLNPVLPAQPAFIERSISDLAARYFANQMKLLDAMAVENIQSISEYIGWVMRGNLSILPRAARLYVQMVRRILTKSGRADPQAERVVRAEHERRMAMLDRHFALPPGTTAEVHALHATPVMRRVSATAGFLGLDLLATAGVLAAVAAFLLLAHPARGRGLALVGIIAALCLMVYVGSLRVRHMTEAGRLQRVAERMAELFHVPCVLFGHSHRAGTWPLRNGGTYFNVGTWIPFAADAYFVYFTLSGGAEATGSLWRWNKRKMQPQRFAE